MSQPCDVLIIGGGSAGLAAAVAAGRCGARTVLLERHGALGGMATAALVHSICGLYRLRDQPTAVLANAGFASEFAGRMVEAGHAWGPQRMGRVDVLLHHPSGFARVCDEFAQQSPNVQTLLHSEVIAVHGRRTVEAVEAMCRGVRMQFEPRVVVDASGDGVIAPLMQLEFEQIESSRLQRPAFIFSLHGVDASVLERDGRLRLAAQVAAAVREGELPRGALGAAFRATGRGGEAFVTIDLDAPEGLIYDPTQPACLTALEMHGRDLAERMARFLREHVAGFADSFVAALPTRVGVRESRRLIGEYRVEEQDLLRGAEFDDAVGLATWPMELRETATGPRLRYPDNQRPCEIPLRALRAAAVNNLFMAGRCMACSHEAQASLRVIGTCLVTGEAAGLAAALAADRLGSTTDRSARLKIDAADLIAARQRIMMSYPAAEFA